MKPTVRKIADDLGLSSATVSKALAGRGEISEETKERVRVHAQKLGYSKSVSVRRRLGVMVVNASEKEDSSILFNLLMGFQKYADSLGNDVIIINIKSEDQNKESLDQFSYNNQLDGLFIAGLKNTDRYYHELETALTPIVLMDIYSSNPMVGTVSTDNISAGNLAIEHLVELGHKRIGFVNGHKEAYVSQERLTGYLAALHTHNIVFDQSLCFDGDFSTESGAKAADYFANKDVSAIYCASDQMALGALQRFHSLGFKLPQDISIIGFDNQPLGLGCSPSLTTIAQNPTALGESACALLHILAQKIPIRHVKLEPWIVVRESTATFITF
ncbi:MAG: LacI family transcriptional regulator [Defluviitaleaceae bacterium]|nr:LacI family transcriptional regulator [Defluviitaleaceae bacterium]